MKTTRYFLRNHSIAYFSILLILISIQISSTSCRRKGCTDVNATNFDLDATKDNGSCTFSKSTFYAKYGYYMGIPITNIDLTINGNSVGTITAVYPNGPGNCNASGTVEYLFKNGKSVDWNTTVHLANSGTVYGSGVIMPGIEDCLKVNVTK